jgi:hypothetical protein
MPIFIKYDGVKGEALLFNPVGPPISDFTTLSGANIRGCTPVDPLELCSSVEFRTTSLPSSESISFNFVNSATGALSSSVSYFADGSFDGFGSFTSLDGNTMITMSPVPEAGVWLALILGFGVIGAMLRRQRALAICAP